MKRVITFATLLICTISLCLAQEEQSNDTIQVNNDNIKVNAKDPFEFTEKETSFDEPIYYYLTSPNERYEIFVFSRKRKVMVNKNRIEVYRKDSNEKLWEKSYNDGAAIYRTTAYGIIEQKVDRVSLLDYTTGEAIWKVNSGNISGYVDDIILFRGIFGVLEGYSLKTGKKKWNTNISYAGGLCCAQKIDDTHDFLITDNVYRFNWNDGTYKYLDAKTSIADKGAIALTVLGAMAGVAVGAAFGANGYIVYPVYNERYTIVETRNEIVLPSSQHKITGIASRVVSEDGRNYFADRNSVTCFDDDMNSIWEVKSPGEKASKSELVKYGESIYMVNFGYAIKGGTPKEIGVPYIAELKANDGTQVFYKELYDTKKIMLSMTVENDKIRMLFDDAVFALSLEGNRICQMTSEEARYGYFSKFISGRRFFVKSQDNCFSTLEELCESTPVMTSAGQVLDISEVSGKSKAICSTNQLYAIIGEKNDLTFLRGVGNNKELWAINDEKAVLLSDDAIHVWILNSQICILQSNGTLLHLAYNK